MPFPGLLSLLAALAHLLASASGKRPERVLSLTGTSFERAVAKHERVLVGFYASCIRNPQNGEEAPWCRACEGFRDEFDKAGGALRSRALKTRLARVEVLEERRLARRFGIDMDGQVLPQLPVLLYFVGGRRWAAYEGAREGAAMAAWLQAREEQAVLELREEEVPAFLNRTAGGERDFALLARVKPGSPRAAVFWSASEAALIGRPGPDRMLIAAVNLSKDADGNRDSELTLWRLGFRPPDAQQVRYRGAWSEADIVRWVAKRTYPSVGMRFDARKYAWDVVKQAGWEAAVVVLLTAALHQEPLPESALFAQTQALAKRHPTWRFVVVDRGGLDAAAVEMLGAADPSVPMVCVLCGGRRYSLEGLERVQDSAAVERFLADVKARRQKTVDEL